MKELWNGLLWGTGVFVALSILYWVTTTKIYVVKWPLF